MNVLIEFESRPLYFTNPAKIVMCTEPDSLRRAFQELERALDAGLYAAGFISYEAGLSLEKKLRCRASADKSFPLMMFGLYKAPLSAAPSPLRGFIDPEPARFCANVTKKAYAVNIARIRRYIELGDVYQITYCIKLNFAFRGSARALYRRLLKEQPVPYPAYIETDDFHILSLSPERFFKKSSEFIITEPMKGTWRRGKTPADDVIEHSRFCRDPKNRAENVMIADLLRNDLGRIGSSVRAPELFTVTGYKTLFQMTSTVCAQIPQNINTYDLFCALFPSGSVTGAPKIRAMEIINEIETQARRIYTGAIGYITPSREMYFNIPIRTLLIKGSSGEMGIGGGIVWDSTAEGEWEEGLLKAAFLTKNFDT